MKKIFKKIVVLVCIFSMLSVTACGEIEQGVRKDRTQLYFSVYNGGTGIEWIETMANEWNDTNSVYQVMISPEKLSTPDIISNIKSGATGSKMPSAYFTSEIGFQDLIYSDNLEDLSDIAAKEVDGVGKGTIKEKIGAKDDYYETVWKNVSAKYGQGLYMLPYCDSFGGLIFDYGTFLEHGWLIYANAEDPSVTSQLSAQKITYETQGSQLIFKTYAGDYPYFNYKTNDAILSCGKDGVYGSYDDGQPINIEQWEMMINKIVRGSQAKAFIWSGTYCGYVDMILEAAMAQYSGIKEFNTYFTFDGEVTVGGVKKQISPENGYEVYQNDSYGKAVNFMNEYFDNSAYYNDSADEASHTEAQSLFVLSYKNEVSDPLTGMLVDGEWFENEARAILNTKSVKEDGYGYGQREYRFMLLPTFEGSYGLDGKGNGSVLSVLNSGGIIVPKNSDKNKLEAIKDFISYTLTNKNLVRFTKQTGIVNAYDYTLTKEDLQELTPFSKNVYEMYHDTKNIDFSRAALLYNSSPMKFATSGGFYNAKFLTTYNGVEYENIIKALKGGISPINLINGAKGYYKAKNGDKGYSRQSWEALLKEAKKMGFYA